MSDKKNLVDKLIRLFPILYVGLIIFGYASKSAFFRVVDISVADYISLTELLFPAISLLDVVLAILTIILPFLMPELYSMLKKSIKNSKKQNRKEDKSEVLQEESSITLIVRLIFFIGWPMIFGGVIVNGWVYVQKNIVFQIISIFWIFILSGMIFFKYFNGKVIWRGTVFLLFSYSILLIIYLQTLRANDILKGNQEQIIVFSYDSDLVESNDSLVYMGKIGNYLFMRNLYSERTEVYNLDYISNLSIEKISDNPYLFLRYFKSGRDWSDHPIYQNVDTKISVNELIEKVERKKEVLILNQNYILPKSVKIHINKNLPNWLKREKRFTIQGSYLLYDIDPPYKFFKRKNTSSAWLIKNGDTLKLTN